MVQLQLRLGSYPSVLSLTDMTRDRGTAENLLHVAEDALKVMELGDGHNFIVVTTDNPTVEENSRKNTFGFWYAELLVTG